MNKKDYIVTKLPCWTSLLAAVVVVSREDAVN